MGVWDFCLFAMFWFLQGQVLNLLFVMDPLRFRVPEVIDSLEHSELADAALLACLEAFREPDAEAGSDAPETRWPKRG